MNITIIGTGYVGLVTGACLAEIGNNVTCIDVDTDRVNKLLSGSIPFYEPGLEDIVVRNLDSKRLVFTDSYKNISQSNIFFICVGTPDKGDGSPDLKNLHTVLDSLTAHIGEKSFVFTKSTVPLGTNKMIQSFFDDRLGKEKVFVSSNPEFLKEGSAVSDFQKPDRIILGTSNKEARKLASDLYAPFNWSKNRLINMSIESAELTKYASNSFLATKISFMNEMALVCENSGANIHEVRLGLGSDPRIGDSFLYAGLGYGGSCFPKDVNALIEMQKEFNIEPGIIERTKLVNDRQVKIFYEKIVSILGSKLKEKSIAIWGLSFKPNTDDVRESVALKLISMLAPKVNSLKLYDPIANLHAKQSLIHVDNLKFYNEKYEAINGVEALVICTEWKEFWDLDVLKLDLMHNKLVFDGRNILDKSKMKSLGVEYYGIGT